MCKRKYKIIALFATLGLAGCLDYEMQESSATGNTTSSLHAIIENPSTRSVINWGGCINWTKNDYVGVFGSETKNARFYFTSQQDDVSTFSGNLDSSADKAKWAYFPYMENVILEGSKFSFHIPQEATISNENQAPMIGMVDESNTIRFFHVGGILHLKLVGVPQSSTQLTISSEGVNALDLAGTAVIDDINSPECTYYIKEGHKEVSYDIRNIEGGAYMCQIYIPLQVGSYEKIRVALKDELGRVVQERTLSNITMSRAKMLETPMINFADCIYAYELSEECLEGTDWDGAIFFSNEVVLGYQDESIRGRSYVLANIFDFNSGKEAEQLLTMTIDENDRCTYLNIGRKHYHLYNHTDSTFDYRMFDGDNTTVYTNLKFTAKEGGTTRVVDTPYLNDLNIWNNICNLLLGNEPENLAELTNAEISVNTIEAIYNPDLPSNPVEAIERVVEHIQAIVQVVNGFHRTESQGSYERACLDAEPIITTSDIERMQIDEANIKFQIRNKNDNFLNSVAANNVTVGFLILSVPLHEELRTPVFFRSTHGVTEKSCEGQKYGSFSCNLKLEENRRYYVKSFISVDCYSVCNYSNVIMLVRDNPIIEDASYDCKYLNGQFHFTINAVGQCEDESQNYYMSLYGFDLRNRSSECYETKIWNRNNNRVNFSVALDRKDMLPSDGELVSWPSFSVECNLGEGTERIGEPKDLSSLTYDKEPSIDLEIQITDGPNSINSTRAPGDDEEMYYVAYKVFVKTQGTGWFETIRINSSDGCIIKTEYPQRDGQNYEYNGSIVYKEKSELPTITCVGVMDGNREIPKEIRLASKL